MDLPHNLSTVQSLFKNQATIGCSALTPCNDTLYFSVAELDGIVQQMNSVIVDKNAAQQTVKKEV